MAGKNYIAIDWGSTNIRAFLYIDGKIVDEKKSHEGVTTVRGKDCEGAFDRLTSQWMEKYGPLPVIMSGMVDVPQGSCLRCEEADLAERPVSVQPAPAGNCRCGCTFLQEGWPDR